MATAPPLPAELLTDQLGALLSLACCGARQMLASPALRRVDAGEIGRRVGLLDASHFARLCRRHLGLPPSLLRTER